jgi:hypothetical protein
VKGPFLKKIPAKMEAMKDLKTLNYTSPRQAIAGKFHISEGLLTALNDGKKFDRAGERIFVTNVPKPAKLTIGRIEVDKVRQTVKAFEPSGALIGFFGNRRQRRKADPERQLQGHFYRCQSDLPI